MPRAKQNSDCGSKGLHVQREKPESGCPLFTPSSFAPDSLPVITPLFDGFAIDPIKLLAGIAAAPIRSQHVQQSFDWLLHFLCRAFGADDGELLLSEPEGKELLISACIGRDKNILLSRNRFYCGEGYPGVAYADERPLVSNHIGRDRLFLRRKAASAAGIHTFVSAPVFGLSGKPIGCLDLAWRRNDLNLENICRILMLAANPLGTVVNATNLGLREQVAIGLSAPQSNSIENGLVAILHLLFQASGADCGHLLCWDTRTGQIRGMTSVGSALPMCPCIEVAKRTGIVEACPVGSGRACKLEKEQQPFDGCRKLRFDGRAISCLPIQNRGTSLRGIAVLGFHKEPNHHPIQSLARLQIIGNEAVLRLQVMSAQPLADRAKPPRLEIRCFGHFEVRVDGRPLAPRAFLRRRALTLLKILILHAGRPIHRERLIELLWPDEDNESVRLNRLYGLIHSLRQAIEPQSNKSNCVYVLCDGENYLFDCRPDVSVDLVQFRQLLRSAEKIRRDGGEVAKIVENLDQVVGIYQGDLFEDDLYANWCQMEREEIRKDFVNALTDLAHIHSELGNPVRALNYLQKALKIDPLQEALHQAMVAILLKLGHSREARKQCIKCFRLLKKELGVEPASEFKRLYQDLRLRKKDLRVKSMRSSSTNQ